MWDMHGGFIGFTGFLPMFVLAVIFAIGFNLVALRLGRNRILWTVLALIPVVNFFFYAYASFAVLLYVLDRLNALTGRPSAELSGRTTAP